jgi:hypothetical protein
MIPQLPGRFEFWQRWLLVVAVLVAAFGLFIAFFNQTPLFDTLFNDFINPVFWDSEDVTEEVRDFQRWIYGVLGMTVAGWGVTMAFVAHYAFRRKERWAWTAIVAAMTLWFVVDTLISLVHGVYFNALAVNVPLYALIMLPMWFTRKAFKR